MPDPGNERIDALLAQGRGLLRAGRSREAADAFGRVLLLRADSTEARQGSEDARAALAEEARQLDVRMDEAGSAAERGDDGAARALLEDVIQRGGDRDRALALLDRLAQRGGRVVLPEAAPSLSLRDDSAEPRPGRVWSRRLFVAGSAFAFGLLAAGVAFSWERLVESLVRAPSPALPEAAPTRAHEGSRR